VSLRAAALAAGALALPFALILSACDGSSGSGDGAAAAGPQMVFMKGVNGAIVPGPGAVLEIAVMNLQRQRADSANARLQ